MHACLTLTVSCETPAPRYWQLQLAVSNFTSQRQLCKTTCSTPHAYGISEQRKILSARC